MKYTSYTIPVGTPGFPSQAKALAQPMLQTREILAANIMNRYHALYIPTSWRALYKKERRRAMVARRRGRGYIHRSV